MNAYWENEIRIVRGLVKDLCNGYLRERETREELQKANRDLAHQLRLARAAAMNKRVEL